MNELNELRKMSKPELLDKCRKLQLDNLEYKKINKKNTKKWFFQKEESIPEETKMNEIDGLNMEFRKAASTPKSINGISNQTSEAVEQMKKTISSLDIGEVLLIPINEMYAAYPKEKRKLYCSKYETKFATAVRQLQRIDPRYKFKSSRRACDVYIQRLG